MTIPAVLFPFVGVDEATALKLRPLLSPLWVMTPVGQEPPAALAACGLAAPFSPGAGRVDPGLVRAMIAEMRRWLGDVRRPGELRHLAATARTVDAEATPLTLAGALRHYGEQRREAEIWPHALLLLAEEEFSRRTEIAGLLETTRAGQARLTDILGLEAEDGQAWPEAAPEESVGGEDPLWAERLGAWAAIYDLAPIPGALWLTSPDCRAFLSEAQERLSGQPAELVGWHDLATGQAAGLEAALAEARRGGASSGAGQSQSAGPELSLWRLKEGPAIWGRPGLRPEGDIIGEVSAWPLG